MSEYDISRAFKKIENELIDSMMRNLERHKAEESKLGFEWEQWQALQLKELERYRRKNATMFTDDFSDINDRMKEAFRTTYKDAQTEQEQKILEQIQKGDFTPTQTADTQFFNINDDKLDILIERTNADFTRAEYAMLRKADDVYRQTIFDAQVYANVTNDYNKAVDMATHDFLAKGIQCVVYKNGAKHNAEEYARMCIRTGNKRAYLMGEGNARDKYGVHTVRVNKRTQACPKCVGFLGRVLVDDVYGGGTAKEAHELGVPTLSQAIAEGFLHPNCKDIYSTYIEGISRPSKPWTREEINEIVGEYNQEQEIQHAVDMAESYARLAKYALDPDNRARYEARANQWDERVEQIKRGEYVGAPRAKVPDAIPVTPAYHEGIRQAIEVTYDASNVKGMVWYNGKLLDVSPQSSIPIADSKYYDAKLSKRIEIPWDSLTRMDQSRVTWNAPTRRGKSFLIQPKDITEVFVRQDLSRIKKNIQPALDAGFTYKYEAFTRKYNTIYHLIFMEKDGAQYVAMADSIVGEKTVSKETIKAIKARQKIVSKKLWDEGVHFRDLTSRQGDDWVNAMQKFHTAVEADMPVTLVDAVTYDNIKGEELYRGIAPASHLRGDIAMTKTPMQCAEQLMEGQAGDCFPSRGIYGDAVAYLSNSTQTGFNYATSYGKDAGGVVARMKIKEDARKITYDEAKDLFNAIADTMGDSKEPYFSRQQRRLTNNVEVGKAMQMLGYDVIYEPYGDGMDVHFYMVLNRDVIVAVKDDWVKAQITEAILKRGHI